MLPVFRCGSCGHGFSPAPGAALLAWYEEAPPDALYLSEETGRRRTARRVLRRIALHKSPPGRLLDAGAGPGFFVDEARKAGWSADGVEAARWAVEWGEAQVDPPPVRHGDVQTLSGCGSCAFRVVTAFDVIEHLEDPASFLGACARVLEPGGLLVLTTPRFDSLAARLAGGRWHCLMPAHVHYFSRPSLRAALERAGFCIVSERSHTRFLSTAYLARRLFRTPGTAAWMRRLVVPVNVGDEFEVVATKGL